MIKQKVAIITSGYLPLPAVDGGGVETLIDYLISENESEQTLDMTIFSSFDAQAYRESESVRSTVFSYIKTAQSIRWLDKIVYWISRHVFRKANPSSYRYILQRLLFIKKVGSCLANRDFDRIIIENSPPLFGVLKTKNNRQKYAGKYYFHLHNEISNDFGYSEDIQKAAKVLGVSHYLNAAVMKKYPDMKEEQFVVLKNGVDQLRFSAKVADSEKARLRKQYGLSEGELVFMFSGRIATEKGLLEALLAFEQADLEHAKFLVVGSTFFKTGLKSHYYLEIEQLVKQMGNRVIMTGFVPNERLGTYYAIADICVLPSIWHEPAGLTMIEALSAGKVLITTNSGGIPEYVPAECAVILNKDSHHFIAELANVMKELYDSPTKRKCLSEKALKLSNHFSVGKMYRNFVKSIE